MRAADSLLPGWIVGLDVRAEEGVFPAIARQDGDEAPPVLVDVVHARLRAKLAVGHVEEIRPVRQFAQDLPGVDVRVNVGRVAVHRPVVDGHGPVPGNREHQKQLLEVGPVILVVPVGDRHGRLAPHSMAVGAPVHPFQGQGRGIIVELIERDVELAHGVDNQFGEQGRAVGIEEPGEGPAHPVVIEPGRLAGLQAQQVGLNLPGPFDVTVDGLAAVQDERAQHNPEGAIRLDLASARQGAAQEPIDMETLQDAVRQRQAADQPRVQHQFQSGLTSQHLAALQLLD